MRRWRRKRSSGGSVDAADAAIVDCAARRVSLGRSHFSETAAVAAGAVRCDTSRVEAAAAAESAELARAKELERPRCCRRRRSRRRRNPNPRRQQRRRRQRRRQRQGTTTATATPSCCSRTGASSHQTRESSRGCFFRAEQDKSRELPSCTGAVLFVEVVVVEEVEEVDFFQWPSSERVLLQRVSPSLPSHSVQKKTKSRRTSLVARERARESHGWSCLRVLEKRMERKK